VGIGFGTKDAPYDIVDTISTGTLGSIRTQVVVPPTSLAGDEWEVILLTLKGRPVLQLVSTPFVVTTRGSPSAVAGSCKPIPSQTDFTHYRVRTGDSLDSIAGQLGLSTASLLAINPLITNPDQVRIDQELVVPAPGHGALAILSPDNGPPGTAATLEGLGFPTNTSLALGLGLWRFDYKPVGVVSTNAIGWFSTPITIPLSAKENQRWAMRITPGSPEAASLDNEPVISNPFTIKQTIPVDQPVVTIYPQSGPPGTSLTVVGAGFPRDSKIILAVGQDEIRAEPVDTSYAGINGTFQSEVTIPTYAASGEAWIVSASTTITVGKVVTDYLAISLPFTITQSKP
jgi:LysM repeat protein